VTSRGEIEDEEKGFKIGAVDYITKPVSPPIVRERVKIHLSLYDQNRSLENKVQERTGQLRKALETVKLNSLDTIFRLSRAAEFKDEDTAGHIQRISQYAAKITEKLNFNHKVVEAILYAAPMHDIGKIGVPDHILLKPGKLNPDEWEIMKQHTVYGARILEGAGRGFIALGEVIALTHHEKWDGSGYPRGLEGKRIPLAGRITAIADVFDALISARPYKKPCSVDRALGIIEKGRKTHFDPQVVDAFFSIKDKILFIKTKYDKGT
jgi:putative two-component system response regulator